MTPARKSLSIINFITGSSDGLKLPLAACIMLIALFPGQPLRLVLGVGVLVALAGAVVFGLARFLGEREEISHRHPDLAAAEEAKEEAMMAAIDIDPGLTKSMMASMAQEKQLWLKEIRENDMDWEEYDRGRARRSGLHTALGFFFGGSIHCCLFLYLYSVAQLPVMAGISSAVVFFTFGAVKASILGRNIWREGVRQLAMGVVMIVAVLVIARLFKAGTPRLFGNAGKHP